MLLYFLMNPALSLPHFCEVAFLADLVGRERCVPHALLSLLKTAHLRKLLVKSEKIKALTISVTSPDFEVTVDIADNLFICSTQQCMQLAVSYE